MQYKEVYELGHQLISNTRLQQPRLYLLSKQMMQSINAHVVTAICKSCDHSFCQEMTSVAVCGNAVLGHFDCKAVLKHEATQGR